MESNILLVDDNVGMIQVMARILTGLGQLRYATNGAAALQQARDLPPDLILLDAEMPDMSGYQVCEAIKADPSLRDIPVIFVTSHSSIEFELRGLGLGAADFIAKPISEPLLLARVRTQLRMKRLTEELRQIASIDSLTDLCNRRSFDDALEREWKRGLRTGSPMSLLLIDVDHFKLFNDRYGHPAGDACLRAVAQVLRCASLRPSDVVARHGGEEFALLLPQTPREGGEHVANRVLAAMASVEVPHKASEAAAPVTVSIGLSSYDNDSACWVEPPAGLRVARVMSRSSANLVGAADRALYAAKKAGRAQGWRLDIDDVDAPEMAREIGPSRAVA